MPVAYEIHDFLTLYAALPRFPDGAVSVGKYEPVYHVQCVDIENIKLRQKLAKKRGLDERILLYPTLADVRPLFRDTLPHCRRCGKRLENHNEKAKS